MFGSTPRALLTGILIAALSFAPVVQACTGIQLVAKDGGVIAARTLEFGIDLQSNVLIIPAGTAMTGTLPDGGKGISYTTKYGIGGANGAGQIAILDGINDHGLYVGLFYFPGFASYADATPENSAARHGSVRIRHLAARQLSPPSRRSRPTSTRSSWCLSCSRR